MKKHINLLLIVFLLFTSVHFTQGQYIVKKVTDQAVNTSQDGFFYSLPLTVLKINLVYEKIDKIKGPLADYTLNYLGTSDYINTNATSYRIIDIHVVPQANPDPTQRYYVQFPSERDKDGQPMTFSLSSIGTLLGFDEKGVPNQTAPTQNVDQTFILVEGDSDFDLKADYNRKKEQDTIVRTITIDTVNIERFIFKTNWVDKSDEDKANEAAMQIARIREGRFNLLTGYQEVNYGTSMQYMDSQLNKMEKQYLELFLGKELKSIESQDIYYKPEKGKTSETLLSLTDGSQLKIKLIPQNFVSNLPENPLEKVDNIYYRIPDQAVVEIEYKGMVYFRKQLTINQLGVVSTAPLNRTRTQFDYQTGGLKKIIRE